MRARKATACADDALRAQRSNITRTSGDNNNGSIFGPRRGTGTSAEALILKVTTDLRRRALAQHLPYRHHNAPRDRHLVDGGVGRRASGLICVEGADTQPLCPEGALGRLWEHGLPST